MRILSPTFRNELSSAIPSMSVTYCWPPGRRGAPAFLPDVGHDGDHKMIVSFTLNGRSRTVDVEPATLVADLLRENLNLTGTHVGCDTSQCGACVVLVDGRSAKACTIFAVQADGSSVMTIEGLAKNGQLHPVQEGFWEEHGLQCGY